MGGRRPEPVDAQGNSLAELKMSFTNRMNEGIRMQREHMQSLLSRLEGAAGENLDGGYQADILQRERMQSILRRLERAAGENLDGGQQADISQTEEVTHVCVCVCVCVCMCVPDVKLRKTKHNVNVRACAHVCVTTVVADARTRNHASSPTGFVSGL